MANFSDIFPTLPIQAYVEQSKDSSRSTVEKILSRGRAQSILDFAALISPAAEPYLESMAQISSNLTQKHFGKVIRLFAPIYLSNECVNICKYCGFSRNNPIPRITIPLEQFKTETKKLYNQGFRSLLIVAGEHPKYVSNGYVEECIKSALELTPSVLLELGPMKTDEYRPLVTAGAEGLIVYQESYHRPTYESLHIAGPKKNYDFRIETPERAYEAGFRRIGIGALMGLYDWRYEALALASHARYLTQYCWKAQLSISLPRMRPAEGGFQPDTHFTFSDKHFVQVITALRMLLPHCGIVLSTREPEKLRDGLVSVGVTNMSAGSSTEPGGYSHFEETNWKQTKEQPGEQFHIADERSPADIAKMLKSKGIEPVWKDADSSLFRAEHLSL
jgi:2-iminoacetate synthase